MSEPNASRPEADDDPGLEAGDELQFDQAEYATPAPAGPSCGVCKRPIDDMYYEINGKVICATCRQRVEAAFRGGSPVARVLKALVFGSVAAIAGAVLYYAISRMTGANWGIVAVVVGFMVGGAVRKGTGNWGGLFYQFLAVFLTYSAIVAMLVPLVIEKSIKGGGDQNQQAKIAAEKVEKERAKVGAEPKARAIAANEPARPKAEIPPLRPTGVVKRDPVPDSKQKANPVEGQDQRVVDLKEKPDQKGPQPSLVGFLVLMVLLTGLFYSLPVHVAFSSPISGLIYCFALWEAWKINKRVQLAINGPFRVDPRGSIAPVLEDVDDGE